MIYLDHAATTPVPRPVADAMYQVLTEQFGNPSSQYPLGREAKALVEEGRAVVAGALGCRPENLHFTSCGTESDNWAISAAVWQGRHTGRHIITTAVEHSAVLEPCKLLQQQGYEVTYLAPDKTGHVTAEQVAQALREDTVDLRALDLTRCAVAIGSEGRGVSQAVLEASARTVKIPMTERCESLNAAIAGAVVLWQMGFGRSREVPGQMVLD